MLDKSAPEDFQVRVQGEFPDLAHKTCLDTACIGTAPLRALRAVTDLVQGMP